MKSGSQKRNSQIKGGFKLWNPNLLGPDCLGWFQSNTLSGSSGATLSLWHDFGRQDAATGAGTEAPSVTDPQTDFKFRQSTYFVSQSDQHFSVGEAENDPYDVGTGDFMVTAMTKGPFDGLSSAPNPVFGNGSGFSAGGRFDLSCQYYAPANVGIGGESRVIVKTELGNANVNDRVENVGGITFDGVNNIAGASSMGPDYEGGTITCGVLITSKRKSGVLTTHVNGIQIGGSTNAAGYTGSDVNLTNAFPATIGQNTYFEGLILYHYDGSIFEVVVSTDAEDDTQDKVEGYLAFKYGRQEDLVSTHTYKNAPPFA